MTVKERKKSKASKNFKQENSNSRSRLLKIQTTYANSKTYQLYFKATAGEVENYCERKKKKKKLSLKRIAYYTFFMGGKFFKRYTTAGTIQTVRIASSAIVPGAKKNQSSDHRSALRRLIKAPLRDSPTRVWRRGRAIISNN